MLKIWLPVISMSRSFASARMLTHGGSGWISMRVDASISANRVAGTAY